MKDMKIPLNAVLIVNPSEQNSQSVVEKSVTYKHMLRNKGTEAIRQLTGRKDRGEYKKRGAHAFVDIGEATITIENFYNGGIQIRTTAGKLFLYLLQEVAPILDRTGEDAIALRLHLELEMLANQFNRSMEGKAKYKFRNDIEEAINALYHLNLTIVEVLNGKTHRLGQARLISDYMQDTKNKFAYNITLGVEFVKYLKGAILMNFYQDIFKITDSTAFNIQSRFNIHYTMRNNHKPRKGTKALVQANVLNIGTLIDWGINIPTIERVKNSDRRITDRILDPIAKALDNEHGMVKKWEWAKQSKEPLTDRERANLSEIVEYLQVHILEVKGESEVTEPIYASIGVEMEKREKQKETRERQIAKAKKVQPKKPKDI
jgi:hypothetical protein